MQIDLDMHVFSHDFWIAHMILKGAPLPMDNSQIQVGHRT